MAGGFSWIADIHDALINGNDLLPILMTVSWNLMKCPGGTSRSLSWRKEGDATEDYRI